MIVPDQLIEHAQSLVRLDVPTEAQLRRASSSAYYALLHELLATAGDMFAPGVRRRLKHQWFLHAARDVQQIYDYQRAVSEDRAPSGQLGVPFALEGVSISVDLYTVALAVVNLQQSRIDADYDYNSSFSRTQAEQDVEQCRSAVEAWRRVSGLRDARAFLTHVLLEARPYRREKLREGVQT